MQFQQNLPNIKKLSMKIAQPSLLFLFDKFFVSTLPLTIHISRTVKTITTSPHSLVLFDQIEHLVQKDFIAELLQLKLQESAF